MLTTSRLVTATVATALLLSACSSSDAADTAAGSSTASAAAEEVTTGESGAAESGTEESGTGDSDTEQAEAAETGGHTGTVTLADGTVIELVVNDCKTKATHPNSFLIDNGFDVSGNSADDYYYFGALKAASEGDPAPLIDLAAERDENRVNPKTVYINMGLDQDVPTTVAADGARVYGEVVLRDFHSQNALFGDTVSATVDFNCA